MKKKEAEIVALKTKHDQMMKHSKETIKSLEEALVNEKQSHEKLKKTMFGDQDKAMRFKGCKHCDGMISILQAKIDELNGTVDMFSK